MKYFLVAAVLASCLAVSYAEISQDRVFSTAFEMMSRASSTSEVLTLNLTNLIIIFFLGLLIIGGGFFLGGDGGFGGGFGNNGNGFGNNGNNGNGNGRSSDLADSSSVHNSDLVGGMCFVMYTSGNLDKLSCVQRTACEDPKVASKYLQAGKLWHKMHKLMKIVPFNDGYLSIMNAVQDATEHSLEGGECSIYQW